MLRLAARASPSAGGPLNAVWDYTQQSAQDRLQTGIEHGRAAPVAASWPSEGEGEGRADGALRLSQVWRQKDQVSNLPVIIKEPAAAKRAAPRTSSRLTLSGELRLGG